MRGEPHKARSPSLLTPPAAGVEQSGALDLLSAVSAMLSCVTFTDWREPVRQIEAATGPASDEQLRLASLLGVPHEAEPFTVTAALLEDFLRPLIWQETPPGATPRQSAFLAGLGHPESVAPMTKAVASAWIEHYLARITAARLRELASRPAKQ